MGNRKKLKGGDPGTDERANRLGFGTGVGGGDEWVPWASVALKASLQVISLSSMILKEISKQGLG